MTGPAAVSPTPRAPAPPAGGYRALMRVPMLGRVLAAATLGRTASQMTAVAIVLFALERYGSPQVAGLAIFLALFPGLVLSPVAGALLDRYGRVRLILSDYLVGAAALASIAVLALAGRLPVGLFLLIAGISSLTGSLSNAGVRSLFPMLIPRPLWDRANAVDSGCFVLSQIAGPALAGALVAGTGGAGALAGTAVVFLIGAALLSRVHMRPSAASESIDGSLLREAWEGLRYVTRNRTLRGIAVSVFVINIAGGGFVLGLPIVVLQRLHQSAGVVGAMWAVAGVGGVVGGMAMARLGTEGRERSVMAVTTVGYAASMLIVALAPTVAVAAAGMLVFGVANGPFDVAMFGLRQRCTPPAWMGRAFAVSMALNFSGLPVGSVLAGPLASRSVTAVLLVSSVVGALSIGVILVMLPRDELTAAPG